MAAGASRPRVRYAPAPARFQLASRSTRRRLLGLTNDLGLLAEEYDVKRERQVGNFPQAFRHLTLIGAAAAISRAEADAKVAAA